MSVRQIVISYCRREGGIGLVSPWPGEGRDGEVVKAGSGGWKLPRGTYQLSSRSSFNL